MGIVSKSELKKRILVGEKLIYRKIRENIQDNKGRLDEKTVERLEKALAAIFPLRFEDKEAWQAYSRELTSKQDILAERRSAIDDCVNRIFQKNEHKNDSKALEKEIANMLEGDGHLKDLRVLDRQTMRDKLPFPIFMDDLEYGCLRMANYDLRLGEETYVTTEKTPRKLNATGEDGISTIEPGEFGILMTHEYLFIPPDLMGFISIRLTYKQRGLVNISGFHVDPGFYGCLVFAVFNAGPNDVPLRYKEPVFMIMFNELTEFSTVEKSRWQGMKEIPIETILGDRKRHV